MSEIGNGGGKYDSGPAREALRLAERMFEETLSNEEQERLDTLISTSEEACRVYWDFVTMQFALCRLNATSEPVEAHEEDADAPLFGMVAPFLKGKQSRVPAEPSVADPGKERSAQHTPQVQSEAQWRPLSAARHREVWAAAGLAVGVAATFLFLGLYGMLQWNGQSPNQEAASRPASQTTNAQVRFAVLTDSVSCQWGGAVPVGFGTEPAPVEIPHVLTLMYGLAQFTVGTDAEVVVEGPAKLSFQGYDTIELLEGKLAVTVAIQGGPVHIITPHGSIQVRPGGVLCADVANSLEVQSLREDADVTWMARDDVFDRRVVAAGKAVRIRPWADSGGSMTEIDFDETHFVTDLSLPFESMSPRDLPVERDLAFWYSADQNVRTNREHKVVCWGDILVGDNTLADNCWQPLESRRPTIVENAINGRPAVRFDGRHQSLISSEVALPDEQTIVMVFCARAPTQESGVEWQNLHANSAVVTLVGPPGIILGACRESTLAYLTVGMRTQKSGGIGTVAFKKHVADSAINVDSPMMATIVYSAKNSNVLVFLNGHRVIDVEAKPGVASDRTNLCFGMNESGIAPFFGDLSEYIHYRRALSSDEVDDLHQYLGERYSLEVAADGPSESP